MKTRASSNEVDYYLHGGEQDRPTIEAICRDWLDMGDRLAAAERVIQAVKADDYWPRVTYDTRGRWTCVHCHLSMSHADDCPGIAIRDALAAYDDATTGSAE